MRFERMREFVALASTLNFMAAAEELYISQATLSKHIKELEAELGGPLFQRTTRRVVMTELGVVLYPYARRAVALEEELQQAVARQLEQQRSTLTVGSVSHWRREELAELITDFQVANPRLHISAINEESEQLMDRLRRGLLNFAFVREPNCGAQDGLVHLPLTRDPLKVFLPRSHPLAGQTEIRAEQLRGEAFLMSQQGSLSYEMGTRACRASGFEPNILLRGNRYQILSYLTRGLGVALLFGPPSEPENRFTTATLLPRAEVYINLVYPQRALNPAEQAFLDFVQQHFSAQ